MTACTHCDTPNHLDTVSHPCCAFRKRIEPARPCGGCAASRDYWRKHRGTPSPARFGYETMSAGFTCSTCGLSDAGLERLRSFGFDKRGCIECAAHFRTPGFTPPAEQERT